MSTLNLIFISDDGTWREVAALPGRTLMRAATENGIDGILAECGGDCACGTCHVYVAPEWAAVCGAPGPSEAELLACVSDPRPSSRLSCQIPLTPAHDGLIVRTPRSQGGDG